MDGEGITNAVLTQSRFAGTFRSGSKELKMPPEEKRLSWIASLS